MKKLIYYGWSISAIVLLIFFEGYEKQISAFALILIFLHLVKFNDKNDRN